MRDTTGMDNWTMIDQVSNNNFTYTDLNAPSGGSRYRIEVIPPSQCTTGKIKDYNSYAEQGIDPNTRNILAK